MAKCDKHLHYFVALVEDDEMEQTTRGRLKLFLHNKALATRGAMMYQFQHYWFLSIVHVCR